MKKVGIMGGTFNPIHLGHLCLAETAYEQLGLDKVLFMPSKKPPHKDIPDQISMEQRVEMITLAIKDNPHFELSMIELERDGITYTADSLTELTQKHRNTEFYFIVGADSLYYMNQWKNPHIIFELCTVVAAGRDHSDMNLMQQQADDLKKQYHASIILIEMPTIQISSAVIKERIAAGKSVRYFLPETVQKFIQKNHLYKAEENEIQVTL